MCRERWIRLAAGAFILISLALGVWVHPNWLFFTAFVGLNLFQSALTRWCLLESILKKIGVPPCDEDGRPRSPGAGDGASC